MATDGESPESLWWAGVAEEVIRNTAWDERKPAFLKHTKPWCCLWSPEEMQAPRAKRRNWALTNHQGWAHHLCLHHVRWQGRHQKPSDSPWAPAEQISGTAPTAQLHGWTTLKETKHSPISTGPLGFCHATNKSSDKEEIPRRHKAAAASAEETSPAFVWEFINPSEGFNEADPSDGNSCCCETAKGQKERGQTLPLIKRERMQY